MWRPREYPQHSFQHTEMHQKPGPILLNAELAHPSEAAFSCRLPGVPLDTKAVPESVAGAQPSSAWTVEAHCCIGYTGILHPMNSQEGRNFPPLTFISHTTKTVSRSSHLWELSATQNESSLRLSSLTFHYRGSERNQ